MEARWRRDNAHQAARALFITKGEGARCGVVPPERVDCEALPSSFMVADVQMTCQGRVRVRHKPTACRRRGAVQ